MASTKGHSSSSYHRALTWLTVLTLLFMSSPAPAAFAQEGAKPTKTAIPAPARPKTVRKGTRKVTTIKPTLAFSVNPTDAELTTARIFPEPLVPMSGKPVPGENQALARALAAFKAKNDPEAVSDLTRFLGSYPTSRWGSSVQLNLGMLRHETGYLSDALAYLKSAWEGAKAEKGPTQKAVADRAVGELLVL